MYLSIDLLRNTESNKSSIRTENCGIPHKNPDSVLPQAEQKKSEKFMTEKINTKLQERLQKQYKLEIVWPSLIVFLAGHLVTLYGTYLIFTSVKVMTIIWMWITFFASGFSITMGAHRLYSHKCFKAKPWIHFILVALHASAGQRSLWEWVRDHRQHHKFSDTDADPHNSKRGFFFSHIGWLLVRKHPDVIIKGKTIDMSDINENAIIMFQKKYYVILFTLLAVVFPLAVPYFLWNETFWNSFIVCVVSKWTYLLNVTFCVNSAAHAFGMKPFNKNLIAVENSFTAFVALGEGWHNYHHSFPWDYRAAEFGQHLNPTTMIIDFCAKNGWIYDLKFATPDLVKQFAMKKGDGTHPLYGKLFPNGVLTTEKY